CGRMSGRWPARRSSSAAGSIPPRGSVGGATSAPDAWLLPSAAWLLATPPFGRWALRPHNANRWVAEGLAQYRHSGLRGRRCPPCRSRDRVLSLDEWLP